MSDFYKIKCSGYKGKMYLFLDEKGFSFKKKKYCLFGEFILVDSFLVSNIKMNKSRSLIRIVDKTVDVIFNDKSLNIKFSNFDDANSFYEKLVELKKNDTFLNRSLYKMQNITEEDVRNGIKTIVKVVGVLGILVHGVKSVVKDGKGIIEEGREVIKSILNFSLILLFSVLTLKVSALLFSVRVLIVLSFSLNCSSTLVKALDKF